MKYVVSIAIFAAFLLLAGCGGGGGGETAGGNGGGGGDGSFSLAAPHGLQAAAGTGAVTLQWSGVEGAEGYALYHATQGGIQPTNFGIWISQHAGVKIENVTSPHTVSGLADGTEYFFVVTATARGQESEPSKEVSAFVPRETGGGDDGSVREAVLLDGEAGTSAVAATINFRPIAAPDDEVAPDGFMLTRLSALLHPAATVGQVNAALQDADARISFMRSGSLTVTLMVPRHATLDEAQTLSDALKQTGAFLSVSPAWSPTVTPPEETEPDSTTLLIEAEHGVTSGLMKAASEFTPLLLPGGEADSNIAHLKAIAMPSAWNLRRLAFDNGVMVPVLVPDAYVRAQTSTQISNLTFVTHRATTTSGGFDNRRWVGNHGWHVAGTIGADFDDARSTGVHPGAQPGGGSPIFRIDAFSVLSVGLTDDELHAEIVDQFPATGPFVINASFGYRMFGGTPSRWQRRNLAQQSLALRSRTSSEEERFVISAAAGNDYGQDARYASAFIANASFDDVRDVVTDPVDREELDELLAWYQTTYPNVDFLKRSRNVLAVGSSKSDGSPSSFTNSIADVPAGAVRAVGSDVFGPCARHEPGEASDYYCSANDTDVLASGTSMAAPQVAGLAAYMWNLAPSLSASEIVRAIGQTYRNGLINAYEASLAAGGLAARRALLDVNYDGRFDHEDLHEILTQWSTGISPRTFSRYDLNGSGRAGGVTRARFDLDADGDHGTVSIAIGATDTAFDEWAVTDAEVLCYYAHRPDVYDGDPIQRAALLGSLCEDAVPGGILELAIREAVLDAPVNHVDLEVCAIGAPCVTVTPRFLAPGKHAVDLPADTVYDIRVIVPGYVDHPLVGIEVGPGETHARTVALWIDTTLVIDRVSIRATVLDAVSGVPLDRLTSKLRPGVGATAGDHVVIQMDQWSPIMLSARSLHAGYYTVEVDREGYGPTWWTVALPFGTEFQSFAVELTPFLPVVTTIEVTPASSETVVGGSVDFTATAFDQNGAVMPVVNVAWSSTHACVATVNARGSATAVGAPGTAQIRATSGDVSGSATMVVAGGTGSAPASVAGRWIVCETSTGDHLLTLDLWHETGQAGVTGQVTMASGALSSASGRWENEVLQVSWDLLVQGGARTFSIVGATPSDEHALRGDYNDRYELRTYPVDLVRMPIP